MSKIRVCFRSASCRDALVFVGVFLLTTAIWYFVYGWKFFDLLPRGDALEYEFAHLLALGGHSELDFLYDPSWQGGGVANASLWISTFSYRLAGIFSANPLTILNFGYLWMQVTFGFLGTQLARFALLRLGIVPAKDRLIWVCVFLLHAFTPMVAWKIYGGYTFYPSIAFLAICVFLLGLVTREMSAFLGLLCLFVCFDSLQTAVYPAIFNAAFFGFPIFLALLTMGEHAPLSRRLWAGGAALALAFAAAIPFQLNLLRHFLSSDTPRSLDGEVFTYRYIRNQWQDWVGNLFWNLSVSLPQRELRFWHEANNPLGPLLVFLFAARKWHRLLLGLAISFALAFFLVAEIHPLSDALLQLVPPLRLFRVPQRALTAFGLFLPTLAGMVLFANSHVRPLRRPAPAFALLGIGVFFLPPGLREGAAWISAVALLGWRRLPPALTAAALGVLTLVSVAAFQERTGTPLPLADSAKNAEGLREKIYQRESHLRDAFHRAEMQIEDAKFTANTAHVLQISSLDGYRFPQRRFSALVSAAMGIPYDSQFVRFTLNEGTIDFTSFGLLYNVVYNLRLEQGEPVVRERFPRLDSVWFPERVEEVADFPALVAELRKARDQKEIRRKAFFVAGEKRYEGRRLQLPPGCSTRPILGAEAKMDSPFFRASLGEGPDCLLVLPTNFAEHLVAKGGDGKKLEVLPVYGALTGVLVPGSARAITVEAQPVWGKAKVFLSSAVLLLLSLLCFQTGLLNCVQIGGFRNVFRRVP